jgi:hypothetical protein
MLLPAYANNKQVTDMQFATHTIQPYSNPLIDPAIRTRFNRKAGIVYGFIFGLGLAIVLWIPDALQLQQASAYLAWAKFPIGLIISLLIGTLAGWIVGRTQQPFVSILIWILAVALIAWIAGHLPYEWVSLIARLDHSYPVTYDFPPFAAGLTGISIVIGMLAGLLTGVFQLLIIESAWNKSTALSQISLRSILALGLCLPIAVAFALFADGLINAPIRAPVLDVVQTIDRARNPASDFGADQQLGILYQYRNQLLRTLSYTAYWKGVQSDPDTTALTDIVDMVFDTGLILRCQYTKLGGVSMISSCSPVTQ